MSLPDSVYLPDGRGPAGERFVATGMFENALYLVYDGFLPSEIVTPTCSLRWKDTDAAVPDVTVILGPPQYEAGAGAKDTAQRIVYPVDIRFDSDAAFDAGRAALRSIAAAGGDTGRFARDLACELDAMARRAKGDPTGALASLLDATYWERAQSWGGFREPTFLDGRLPDRFPMFLRAELLHEAGQDSAAAVWYRVAADGVWFRAPALLRLAEIRQDQGFAGSPSGNTDSSKSPAPPNTAMR